MAQANLCVCVCVSVRVRCHKDTPCRCDSRQLDQSPVSSPSAYQRVRLLYLVMEVVMQMEKIDTHLAHARTLAHAHTHAGTHTFNMDKDGALMRLS